MALIDQKDRVAALQPEGSFIVQAPAGSGKTGLLIRRYLKLLTVVESPEEIIAITFTRKASSEMRERILSALNGDAPDEDVRELAADAAKVAESRNWRLFENPSRLRVQTIDGFCQTLIRQMPWTAGLGAPPGICEEPENVYREAARNTLALINERQATDSRAALTRLLGHFDNNFVQVENMLAGMLARRDQWAREIMRHRDDRKRMRDELEHAMTVVVQQELRDLRDAIPGVIAEELVAVASMVATWLVDHPENVPEDFPALVDLAGARSLPNVDEYRKWHALIRFVLVKKADAWRKSAVKGNGFPLVKDDKNNEMKPARERFKTLSDSLHGADPDLLVRFNDAHSLPAPEYDDIQWQLVEALTVVLPLALAELQVMFSQLGEVDYTEVLLRSHQALEDEEGNTTDLALRLDYRIQHILVDEYQDTSSSQEELLRFLTAGWDGATGDNRSLFLVGDPMQSIYRFRKADVGLFVNAVESGLGNVALEPLKLKMNFRSSPDVVNWVNETFSRILPAEADALEGAVPLEPSEAFKNESGSVAFYPHAHGDRESEARQVVEIIRNAQTENPEGTIGILIRGRNDMRAITPALLEAGIAYQGTNFEQLSDQSIVQDLMALTRALLHTGDRVAWLATLRAPWIGLSLADLAALVEVDTSRSLLSAILGAKDNARISADGQARLARSAPLFEAAVAQRRRGLLRRAVEKLWIALEGPACVDARGLSDAEAFLDVVESVEQGGDIKDLADLDSQVDGLYAAPDLTAEQVQVMTIHRSKGLEFDTVILPGLGNRGGRNETKLLNLQEVVVPSEGEGEAVRIILAPPKATGGEDDALYKWLNRLDSRRGNFELGRLLYVACTRARHHLHLLGGARFTTKEGAPPWSAQKNTLLELLWPVFGDAFDELDPPEDDETENDAVPGVTIRRLPGNFKAPDSIASIERINGADVDDTRDSIEYSWAGENARQIGTVVHDALMRIANEGVSSWDNSRVETEQVHWRAELRRVGIVGADLDKALARVTTAVINALGSTEGKQVLGEDVEHALSEYPLTAIMDDQPRRVVIDRTYVKDGVRWVVDYKTSSHTGGKIDDFLEEEKKRYRDQLKRYAHVLRLKDPQHEVRAALYFPLLDRLVEVDVSGD